MTQEKGVHWLETPEKEAEVLAQVREIIKEFDLDLEAELFPLPVMSKGTHGDEGTYTRVILLTGTYPGNELLAKASTAISNRTPVNRVAYEIKTASP